MRVLGSLSSGKIQLSGTYSECDAKDGDEYHWILLAMVMGHKVARWGSKRQLYFCSDCHYYFDVDRVYTSRD